MSGRAFELNKRSKPEWKTAIAATGQSFDAKVRYARETAMISGPMADSIQYLHSFRNSAYHQGSRHDGILHSLAAFYFRAACSVLGAYRPTFYGASTKDKVSHRAVKYLGKPDLIGQKDAMQQACFRLIDVAGALDGNLVEDLQADMQATIKRTDEWLDFISTNAPNRPTRAAVVLGCQAWPLAWTDEGKAFAKENGCKAVNMVELVDWLGQNCHWQVKADPIVSWIRRHASLKNERDLDAALKKYCDFMKQTETFREALGEAVFQLDGYIQQQIDEYRGSKAQSDRRPPDLSLVGVALGRESVGRSNLTNSMRWMYRVS